jgi:putative spermidine/putrescine transport system ATP-binding protein
MSRIRFESVSKAYGETTALDGFDLDVGEGEFLALLGPSGCGKTTALRLLAGFLQPTAGRILVDDRDVSALPPHKRNAGMVFQDYALFPHMTVEDNIAFGLHERGQKGAATAKRVAELLDLVRLAGMGGRYPGELSGGQQQRVALARALAFGPSVLLMDEPFGALDLKLREAMQTELVQIQRQLGITTLFVTHDQVEAMAVADRIAVMSGGRIAQLGTPEEVYERPANSFVAQFVGRINLFPASIADLVEDTAILDANGARLTAARASWMRKGMDVDAAVRPEWLSLSEAGRVAVAAADNVIEGTVAANRFAGSTLNIEVETARIGRLAVETRSGHPALSEGTAVSVAWPQAKTILLRKPHNDG